MADGTYKLVEKIKSAEAAFADYLPGYRPLHRQVRALQGQINRNNKKIVGIEQDIRRIRSGGGSEPDIGLQQQNVEILKQENSGIESEIPGRWKEARAAFQKLAKAERKARFKYRRNVDDAYDPVAEMRRIIAQADALGALKAQLSGLELIILGQPPKQAMASIKLVESALGSISGASPIRSKISKARRALRGNNPKPDKAVKELAKALTLFAADMQWRQRAARELAADLATYDLAIRGTIGLRQQERLTTDQAVQVASCKSVHRDISLHF